MPKKTNVTINGKEYYRIRVTIGTDKNGKSIIKNFYGVSKSDAERQRDEWLKNRQGSKNFNEKISLAMAMYEWMWDVLRFSKIKPSTFERYEGIYRNYIEKSSLGIMRIEDIERITIRKFYNKLFLEGKTYSQIKNTHKVLSKFFSYLIEEDLWPKNPCARMDLSQYKSENIKIEDFDSIDNFEDEGKIETFAEEEVKAILNGITNKKLRILVAFALGTGLREGEILALKQTDIKDMTVYVTKTVKTVKVYDDKNKYHYETVITPPKTKKSKRKVPIPSNLKQDLAELNKIRNMEKLKLGELYQDNDLLFPSETGTYINARNLARAWKRALEKIGVPYKKFHALRHTYATQLLKSGTQLITVSRLLGHASVKTTEIYVHVLESIKKHEVESLNHLFN